jgi:uncharacterized LabA/DUF88 family protein
VFVDGENLRHSLVDLFRPQFKNEDYLPNVEWGRLFGYLSSESGAQTHVRSYWYTVNHLDFRPWKFPRDIEGLQRLLSKHQPFAQKIHEPGLTTAEKEARIRGINQDLKTLRERMQQRFNGWTAIQEAISGSVDALEFRRAGAITYDLFNEELRSEKSVDVKLATDLLELREIYDVAVIVSGDQDYVPAVQAIKDSGKRVMNVCFLRKTGELLPGGARRLNQCTDRVIQFPYDKLRSFMNFAAAVVA